MADHSFVSAFSRSFDTIVVGSGYAGFAAARKLRAAGQDVLLVGPRGDLLEESGRLFSQYTGSSDSPEWQALTAELDARGAILDGQIDGAVAEIVANHLVQTEALPVLYYVRPVAAQLADGALVALTVATKSGPKVLRAARWIDATDQGLLAKLTGASTTAKQPVARTFNLYYHLTEWPALDAATLTATDPTLRLETTGQAKVRRLSIALAAGDEAWSRGLPAAAALHAAYPDQLRGAVMSHCSLGAYAQFAAGGATVSALPTNLALAVPALATGAVATLADRFALGLAAATTSASQPAATVPATVTAQTPNAAKRQVDVVVAGAGTGGAMAAIAAGRSGGSVVCVDPLAFPGGIGAGGGIHWYYFGVSGGQQAELDSRVMAATPDFGPAKQVHGFHPDVKKFVLLQMFAEAGVEFLAGAMLYDVERDGDRVVAAWIATEDGPIRIEAASWIDSTGDADLCALAGANTWQGREGDGQVHAYSQSIGRIVEDERGARMTVTNFDAGWTDPTDPEDLTRARLAAIGQYWDEHFGESRPTYVAPAIGLRQSRHVKTDYELTLSDLIEGASFADCVGYTGSHYDNHAIDYQFESDEGMYWVWACQQWRARTRCEIPYRMLIPADLSNVWVACRAAGMTPDAHHSCRMQRDMQRLGEVAGYAASQAATSGTTSRAVDTALIRDQLLASGALKWEAAETEHDFGPRMDTDRYQKTLPDETIDAALANVLEGKPGFGMWHLYRHRDKVESALIAALEGTNDDASWFAACVVAMWGDGRAEARLLRALDSREYGFAPDARETPETNSRLVSRWIAASTLLRICGTRACLPSLLALAAEPGLARNVRTVICTTLERLLARGVIAAGDIDESVLVALASPGYTDGKGTPQMRFPVTATEPVALPTGNGYGTRAVLDFNWQLHLVVGRLRRKLGLPLHAEAQALATDDRALVRLAFAKMAG